MKHTSYYPFAKFLHWAIVILVAIQFVSGWLMPSMRHGVNANYFTTIHLYWGLLLVPLAGLLFFMRFYKPVARPEMETVSNLIKVVTIGTHYLFYLLLLLIPLSGWMAVSLREAQISFFNLFSMPLATINNPSFLYTFGKMHSELATFLGLVALGHIAAALYHHFVLKDSVLERMRVVGKVD